jgi:hypothetical protein
VIERTNFDSFGLYAAQLTYILSFEDPRSMRAALEKPIPRGLMGLYGRTLQRIKDKNSNPDTAKTIFSWIYHAKRDMTMLELRTAIGVRQGDSSPTKDLMTPERIVQVCKGLIRYQIVSGLVTFAHDAALREFFSSDAASHDLLRENKLAISCLTSLSFSVFEQGMCDDEAGMHTRMQTYHFGQYAAQYWPQHMKGEGEQDETVITLMMTVATNPMKFSAMIQLSKAEVPPYWLVKPDHQDMQLIHIAAANGLETILKRLLRRDIAMVPDFPICV